MAKDPLHKALMILEAEEVPEVLRRLISDGRTPPPIEVLDYLLVYLLYWSLQEVAWRARSAEVENLV